LDGLQFVSAYPPAPPGGGPTCNPYGLTAPDAELKTSAASYFVELAHVKAFFTQLSKTYEGFGALAGYGASAQVNQGLAGLTSATNDYLKATGANPLPANVTNVAAVVGGILVQEEQKRRVKEASASIRDVVEKFNAALKAHKAAFTQPRVIEIRDGYKVVTALWCIGLLDARAIIENLSSGYGLAVAAAPDTPVDAKDMPLLKTAIEGVIQSQSVRAQAASDSAYDGITDGLDNLVNEHNKLERGQPVDIGTLQTKLAQLRQIIELYNGKGSAK
jgi:hypothetical protein